MLIACIDLVSNHTDLTTVLPTELNSRFGSQLPSILQQTNIFRWRWQWVNNSQSCYCIPNNGLKGLITATSTAGALPFYFVVLSNFKGFLCQQSVGLKSVLWDSHAQVVQLEILPMITDRTTERSEQARPSYHGNCFIVKRPKPRKQTTNTNMKFNTQTGQTQSKILGSHRTTKKIFHRKAYNVFKKLYWVSLCEHIDHEYC